MKITVIDKVSKNKIGVLNKNGVVPKPNEEFTFEYLTLFGFNVELIQPTSARKVKNPDVLIMGAVWEVKTPTSYKLNTIRNRFREASDQATKIIFDLRLIKNDTDKIERLLIGMFKGDGLVRRMIIIKKDGKVVDFVK
ncbi:hypothetical protein IJI86_02315 [Candidatus Saccharibacteria bacterium]|nr:hypothetical protein [Candidatus Saccharibacteria bacterium]